MRQRVVSDTEDSSPFYQWVSTNGKGWRPKQQRKHNDLMDAPRDGFKGGTGKGIHFDGIFLVVIIWDYETLKQQLEGSSREWPAEGGGDVALLVGISTGRECSNLWAAVPANVIQYWKFENETPHWSPVLRVQHTWLTMTCPSSTTTAYIMT